jgi:hypothetical protein
MSTNVIWCYVIPQTLCWFRNKIASSGECPSANYLSRNAGFVLSLIVFANKTIKTKKYF